LTRDSEIGITIKEEHQGKGYGRQGILCLMYSFPINFWLANINPKNTRSVELFKSLGFHLYEELPGVQETYVLQRSEWIDSGLYDWTRRELDKVKIDE
jgi:L-amino acid N-acyltransferase YncA